MHAVEICLCHLVRQSPSLNNNENEGKEQILYQIYQNYTPSCPVCVDEGETAVSFLKEYFTRNEKSVIITSFKTCMTFFFFF